MQRITLPISPARHAAQMGLILGAFHTIIYGMWMYTPSYPVLILPCCLGGLLSPVLAYRLGLRFRNLFPEDQPYPFIIAWAHMAQMYMFAGLILLLPMYFYLTQALPEQLPAIEAMLEQLYQQVPDSRTFLSQLYQGDPMDAITRILSRDKLLSNLWAGFSSNVFWGAIVSLINALILKRSAKQG